MSQTLISPPKVTATLLATIAITVVLAILLWFWVDTEPVRNPYLNIEALPSAQIHAGTDIDAVLARPLFWQEREPVLAPEETVAEVETAKASPLMNIRLLGIILTGDVRTALLKVEDKIVSVQAGQVIQNWTVDKITAKEVSFVADDEQTALSLVRERPDSIQLEKTK